MYRFEMRTLLFVLSAATLMAGQSKDLGELTRESSLIVLGHVTAADSYAGPDGEIYTTVTVSTESVLKDTENATQSTVQFTVKGGAVGDRVVYFSDAPQFAPGEDVVLFSGTGQGIEKLSLDPVRGQDLLSRIEQLREDAGENVPEEERLRARYFINRVGRGGRERADPIVLDAVSCSAYTGPKWAAPAATYAIGTNLPAAWSPLLQSAAQTWNVAGSRFVFSLNTASPHTIALGDLGAGGPLASTRVEYDQSSMQMLRFTLTFNSRYTWTTTGEAGKFDVQAIATHELGHALGLNHPADRAGAEETMWASAGAGETKKRSLETGDKAGVVALYSTIPPPPPAAPTALTVSGFALVTPRAVAGKPTVILFQGTGFDPAKVQGLFTGGICGTAGCVGAAFAASDANLVFINSLPAGSYSLGIRNGATGVLSAPRSFTVYPN